MKITTRTYHQSDVVISVYECLFYGPIWGHLRAASTHDNCKCQWNAADISPEVFIIVFIDREAWHLCRHWYSRNGKKPETWVEFEFPSQNQEPRVQVTAQYPQILVCRRRTFCTHRQCKTVGNVQTLNGGTLARPSCRFPIAQKSASEHLNSVSRCMAIVTESIFVLLCMHILSKFIIELQMQVSDKLYRENNMHRIQRHFPCITYLTLASATQ